jgi:hypothetical protein
MATQGLSTIYCTDDELLAYVQHIVEEWFRTTYRQPFTDMLRANHPERCPTPCFVLDSAQRRMYPMLAAMIRFGEAHATFNRRPLVTALHAARRPVDENAAPDGSMKPEPAADVTENA